MHLNPASPKSSLTRVTTVSVKDFCEQEFIVSSKVNSTATF